MVTFTCQNCNSCLKKKAVQAHLYKCRQSQLTCIDCLKDFDSQSYVSHVSCVTENEKYGGQGFVPSSAMLKQNIWHQSVVNVAKSKNLQPPTLRNIIQFASENPNCPRNKKKFIKYIVNVKAFNQSKTIAENAFDMILEDYSKNQKDTENNVNGKTNEETERQGGKRKKISETEIQDEASNSTGTTQTPEKTSKKKNKKHNGEIPQQNGSVENVETGHKKNKKKKKQNSLSDNQEQLENGNEDSAQIKKKKEKKKKESINQESKADDYEEGQNPTDEVNGHDNSVTDEVKCVATEVEDLAKLSKKERKKLLKQKKYEAELVSIENYKKEDEEENNEISSTPAEETDKKQKKKKNHAEEEKIKQQKNSISEPDDKKIRLEDEEEDDDEPEPEVQKPKKFKWNQVVIEVLRGQDDGEMSLKRLSKKVCAEYASILGEPKCWEEVLLKFNKKVTRIPGVRVFKDKAKLINES